MVRNKGLEPLRHETSDPKSDASAIPPIPQKARVPAINCSLLSSWCYQHAGISAHPALGDIIPFFRLRLETKKFSHTKNKSHYARCTVAIEVAESISHYLTLPI